MDISLTEHRELADYVARKVMQGADVRSDRHAIAGIIWDAIEDYTATKDDAPDAEDTGRADDFADHYLTRSL